MKIKTKGSYDVTSGFATIEAGFHLDDNIVDEIEAAAIEHLKQDKRLNADTLGDAIVTDITIAKPYHDKPCNVTCKVHIDNNWSIDVILWKHNINFELKCTFNKSPSS